MTEFNKPTQEDWDALAEKQVAATGRAQRETLEDATVRAAHKVMTEFNDIERQAQQRKESVQAAMRAALASDLYDSGYKDGVNDTIEEVAQHIEKMKGFGNDTISSFAIFIRGMKR